MKQKTNKDLIIFIILIPVFLGIAFYIQNRTGSNIPAYTINNRSKAGSSVFFEAMQELGYPVEKSIKSVEKHNTSDLQIVVPSSEFDIQSEEIKEWVEKGGRLIYFSEGSFTFINYGQSTDENEDIMTYEYGKGKVITTNINHITNKTLLKNRDIAYNILQKIEGESYSKICFNESYIHMKSERKTLWGALTLGQKFIVFQFIVVLIGFFYLKGRRFGKPTPLYEEVERVENEYLYSAAGLYRHGRCWDLIAENYYKNFLRQISRSHDDWLEFWEEQELPLNNKAKKVYDFMHNGTLKPKTKEYAQIVSILDQLTSILNKRRDSHWKTLKTTQ